MFLHAIYDQYPKVVNKISEIRFERKERRRKLNRDIFDSIYESLQFLRIHKPQQPQTPAIHLFQTTLEQQSSPLILQPKKPKQPDYLFTPPSPPLFVDFLIQTAYLLILHITCISYYINLKRSYHSKPMSRLLRNPPKGPHIEVNISTWNKDSHGLYDYQATEDSYKTQTYYIKNSAKVYRELSRGETHLDTANKLNEATHAFIGEILIDKSKANPEFRLKAQPKKEPETNQEGPQLYRTTYLVVRDFSKNGINTGYPLRPGNVIKLGRVEYMVIESKNETETYTLRDTNHFEETNGVFEISKNKIEHDQAVEAGENNCKVCLCNEETQDDPLISPCKCKGTCRLIHVGCLKTWINSKVKKELKGIAASYNFTKFQCEICKFPFPQQVRFEDKDVEMMTITKPNKPYILLESLCNKQENKEERCLHLISTEENTPIKIGRGHECEIRITDISVSRKHAQILLKEGEFYIADTKAKFGTLIKLEEDFVLSPARSIKIQCGRTVYEFKAKCDPQEDVDTQ